MELSPRVLGALAAALVAGVAGGAVLGKVPPMQRMDGADPLADARPVPPADELELAPQDQDPIVTREGRFEVARLSDRGLYRNRRYSPVFAVGGYDASADAVAAASRAAAEPEPPAPVGEVIEIAAAPEAAAASAEPQSASATAEVTPRSVDVTAQLAALD